MTTRWRCGDYVESIDESRSVGGQPLELVVAYADYETGYFSWSGRPSGEDRIDLFRRTKAATDEEHERDVDGWVRLLNRSDSDHRAATVARMYRPSALLPDYEQRVEQAEAALFRAHRALNALRQRIEAKKGGPR